MGGWMALALWVSAESVLCPLGSAQAGPPQRNAGQLARPPRPVLKPRTASALSLPLAGVTVNVTPPTITFFAADPDASPVAGNSGATVSWTYDGQNKTPWNLTVQGDSAVMSNCPGIPASAILVTCTAVNVSKNGGGSCSGAFP